MHGPDAAAAAIAASEALFGQGDLTSLDAATLASALRELPHAELPAGTPVVQALVDTGLVASLSEARRAIAQGGVSLDGLKVEDDAAVVQRLAARRGLGAASRQEDARAASSRPVAEGPAFRNLRSPSASMPFTPEPRGRRAAVPAHTPRAGGDRGRRDVAGSSAVRARSAADLRTDPRASPGFP